jgi:glycine/D-amino acid oxidase-like deaminating enzyme/nitrite reductase/ring-hydroxylating ferredoxin subunit
VLEALQVGQQVTGRSTAKVTSQHGLIYQRLAKSFGEDGARAYGAANQAGLEQIASFVQELDIACDFERKAAFVYARSDRHVAKIEKEVEVARRLGLPAAFVRDTSLPFPVAGAIRFDHQAQFHPCKYLLGLARSFAAGGGRIFERTRVVAVEHGEPCRVSTERGTVTARDVVEATHLPLGMQGMFFARAYPYAHAMAAARIEAARAPDGMFISAETPTHSVRTARWGEDTFLVAVGGSYKPGHTDEQIKTYDDLAAFLRDAFGIGALDYCWTNEDYESMDGVPFVGRARSGAAHVYVATGFNAWGITNGTAAGMMLADLICQRTNPWAAVFDATRIKPAAGGASFVSENVSTGLHLVEGYVRGRPRSLADLKAGEGAVLKLNGERVAAYRDEQGSVHAVSAVCTHLRCILGWNPTDRTWDCPCHGSRFALDGAVLHGPATARLERKALPQS